MSLLRAQIARCDLCGFLTARFAVVLFLLWVRAMLRLGYARRRRHSRTPLSTSDRNETEPKRSTPAHRPFILVAPDRQCVKGEVNAQGCAPLTHWRSVANGR